jgi:hypothetical protein
MAAVGCRGGWMQEPCDIDCTPQGNIVVCNSDAYDKQLSKKRGLRKVGNDNEEVDFYFCSGLKQCRFTVASQEGPGWGFCHIRFKGVPQRPNLHRLQHYFALERGGTLAETECSSANNFSLQNKDTLSRESFRHRRQTTTLIHWGLKTDTKLIQNDME